MVTAVGVAVNAIAAAATAVLACWHRKRANDRRWAAQIGRRVREIETVRAEVAELEAMFAAESAEDPS